MSHDRPLQERSDARHLGATSSPSPPSPLRYRRRAHSNDQIDSTTRFSSSKAEANVGQHVTSLASIIGAGATMSISRDHDRISISATAGGDLGSSNGKDGDENTSLYPPSFAESQFATIIRRQRKRRPPPVRRRVGIALDEVLEEGDGPPETEDDGRWNLKLGEEGSSGSRPEDDWLFAGWGSMHYLDLTPVDLAEAQSRLDAQRVKDLLGQWRATAIAGNAVTGSIFYAFPAVSVLAGALSPISLLISTLLLGPFRPVLVELTSALSLNSASYGFLSNAYSSKTLAVVGAALTLLDGVATACVSASTASAYLAGEVVHMPFGHWVVTVGLLVVFVCLTLSGMRDSSGVAFGMCAFHLTTMSALAIASIVGWARTGNAVLASNWNETVSHVDARGVCNAIFQGVCIGFVGLTGFECAPSYVSNVRPGAFPKALRNLHITVLLLNAPLMLLLLANLPLTDILSGANVLSALANDVAGRWLRIVIVVDAMAVLCGGILTGVLSFSGLVEALSRDHILPSVFLRTLPTGSPYLSVVVFLLLCLLGCATASFNLQTLSSVFSVSFICILCMFCLSLLLLKIFRPRIPRSEPPASLLTVFAALMVGVVALVGNIITGPSMLLYFAAYTAVIAAFLLACRARIGIGRAVLWLLEQMPVRLRQARWCSGWANAMRGWMVKEKRHAVIYFTKTDEISHLIEALLYVRKNERTSCVKLVHCYDHINQIPSEIESNQKLVDEAFPTITVDLVFVEGAFNAQVVEAISRKLDVHKSLMFMSCPGPDFKGGSLSDLGVRVIMA